MSEEPSSQKTDVSSWNKIRYALRRLGEKERFLSASLLLLAVIGFFGALNEINARFSVIVPDVGGTIKEGIVGSPRFINPLLAVSDPDRDIANLVYSGLMRPDGKGNLVADLAESYEISEDGLFYVFHIKEEVFFHDGEPLTADDIIFTIQLAKNPALKSPLRANWEGVELEKIDDKTVRFILRRPYAPFLENTTIGIMPKHIWKDISAEEILLSEISQNPVGSGPYRIEKISNREKRIITSIELERFSKYPPPAHLKKIVLKFYPSESELIDALNFKDIDAAGTISPKNIGKITRKDTRLETLTLPRIFGIFFNQSEKALFLDKTVREALILATNKERIIREVLEGYALEINSPLPPGTFASPNPDDPEQANPSYNTEAARELLEKNGWKLNEESGIYEKIEKGEVTQTLSFSLATSNAPDLVRSADILKDEWEKLGAKVEVRVFEINDLNQNVIRPRKYDALLFGEVVGRDPDPFAFWHSSQRNDPGLNIALYTNSTVDKILEEARGITSRDERREKYEEFQKEIDNDLPAIFIYSPYFLYVLPDDLRGFETENITVTSERFSNLINWHFETRYVWKIFYKE